MEYLYFTEFDGSFVFFLILLKVPHFALPTVSSSKRTKYKAGVTILMSGASVNKLNDILVPSQYQYQ